ncbi:MAG: oligosaccharide flippase family protein [Promethearchaeota archaeon]
MGANRKIRRAENEIYFGNNPSPITDAQRFRLNWNDFCFFAVAQVFIDSGFGSAYIQKKDVTDDDANTVFYTNLFISIILYGILWLAAPAIAKFYRQPRLINLTRVMGLVVVINAFNVIQIAFIIKFYCIIQKKLL